jgi:hypothetical protein
MHEEAVDEYIRNLKCCGNCKYYFTLDCPIHSDIDPNRICDNWTFDEMTHNYRLVT